MTQLHCTLIDVGWGDSILLEFEDGQQRKYALIDCNDTHDSRSALIHLKRRFEQSGGIPAKPALEFVALTHHHADHANGLQRIIRTFGAKRLYYADSPLATASTAKLVSFARQHCPGGATAVTAGDSLSDLPPVSIEVVWPLQGGFDARIENNNSLVLVVTLGMVAIVLTGDAEADVWPQLVAKIPPTTTFFKVPHHGAANGVFDRGHGTPWLDALVGSPTLVTSAHCHPHPHPDPAAVQAITNAGFTHLRTDENHHIKISTNGFAATAAYTH